MILLCTGEAIEPCYKLCMFVWEHHRFLDKPKNRQRTTGYAIIVSRSARGEKEKARRSMQKSGENNVVAW